MPHGGLYTGLQAQICAHPEPRSPKSCLLGTAQPWGGMLDSPISLVFGLPVGMSCQVGVPQFMLLLMKPTGSGALLPASLPCWGPAWDLWASAPRASCPSLSEEIYLLLLCSPPCGGCFLNMGCSRQPNLALSAIRLRDSIQESQDPSFSLLRRITCNATQTPGRTPGSGESTQQPWD